MKKMITKFELCSCDNCGLTLNSREVDGQYFIPDKWESFEINKKWLDLCDDCLCKPIKIILDNLIYRTIPPKDNAKHFNG